MKARWVPKGGWVHATARDELAWPALRILTDSNTGNRNRILEEEQNPNLTVEAGSWNVDVDV